MTEIFSSFSAFDELMNFMNKAWELPYMMKILWTSHDEWRRKFLKSFQTLRKIKFLFEVMWYADDYHVMGLEF